MNHQTGRLVSLLLAVCMVLALAACGDKTTNPDTGANQSASPSAPTGTDTNEPAQPSDPVVEAPPLEAGLDPAEIEWGYDSPGSSDYQHWYPDGDKLSDYYIIFEDGYLTVDDDGSRTTFDTDVEDWHIVNWSDDDPAFDFVFVDVLTCYDLVGGQWYLRADYDAVMDSLTASTFYCEAGDQWNITFYDDGTYSYDRDGELVEGEWWFQDANTINYIDDYGETWFKITYAEDSWEVVSIKDTDTFYPWA